MSSQRKYKFNELLPVFLVIGLILAIPILLVAINLGFNPFTRANPTETPKQVQLSNISPNSATVSFLTPGAATDAFINYGINETNLTQKAIDARDTLAQSTGNYKVHLIDFKGLQPNTTYFYTIVIGGIEYKNEAGEVFEFKTLVTPDSPLTPSPALGAVNPVAPGTLVLTHAIKNGTTSTTITSLTSAEGTFSFDLSDLKDKNTGAVFDLSNAQLLTFVITEAGEQGGKIYASNDRSGTINAVTGYPTTYSNTLTSLPTASITPTVTFTTAATPTPTPTSGTTVTITPTPTVSLTPSVTGGMTTEQSNIFNQMVAGFYSTGSEQTDPEIPFDIIITNLSASSAAINWRTKQPTIGEVKIGTTIYKDERDVSAQVQRYTHKVTVNTSQIPQAGTTFSLLVNSTNTLGREFGIKPVAITATPPSPQSKEGTVTTTYSKIIDKDLMIFMRKTSGSTGSTWKSSVVTNPNFSIPIGDVYAAGLTGYFSDATNLEIKVFGEYNAQNTSTATTSQTTTINLAPGLSIINPRYDKTFGSGETITGTAPSSSAILLNINGVEQTVVPASDGFWRTSSGSIRFGENNIKVTQGTLVAGLVFNSSLNDLPDTAISDQLPLILGVSMLIIGFVLRKRIAAQRNSF